VPLVVYRPPSSSPDPTLSSHESKAPKYGHCRVRTSSIGADRGDDGIWIYGLVGSFVTFNNVQIPSYWTIFFDTGQIASGCLFASSTINFIIGLSNARSFRLWHRQIVHFDLFLKSDRFIGVTTAGSRTAVFICTWDCLLQIRVDHRTA
jgi:hypothetical protein